MGERRNLIVSLIIKFSRYFRGGKSIPYIPHGFEIGFAENNAR